MLRRIISILVLFAILVFNFSKLILLGDYELNKQQITELYCVNKDKPMLHCCGKCMLKKKFAEDDTKKNTPAVPDAKNDIQLYNPCNGINLSANEVASRIIYSPFHADYSFEFSSALFHPPVA
ncbi:MAG: hypothetical protein HKL88_00025 [Bacteroidia bacterium]|jgi:hypothetical protein|nr:hypothetical protein [Bacteroidia bacterium]